MEVLNSTFFWGLVGTVGAIVSAIGGVIIALVKRIIDAEMRRSVEIHDTLTQDLADKETRIRRLEANYSHAATRDDIAVLRGEMQSQFDAVRVAAEKRHEKLIEIVLERTPPRRRGG